MKESFQYILDTYSYLGSKVDKGTETYRELTHVLPEEIKKILKDREDLIVKGSMGQGNRTDYPWISILNRNVTTSTQKGLYVVFLFKKDMSGFYLTLNQGITNFENKYKKDKYTNAVKVSTYFRSEIDDDSFSKDPISLGSNKKDLGYGYEKTTVIQTYYPSNNFSEEKLEQDLIEIMGIYDSIVDHFDSANYDTVIDRVLADETDHLISADEAIEQIKEVIDPYDDIPFGFNRSLKLVEAYSERDNKFSKITTPRLSKIDYAKKAAKDAETGLLGEELVMKYEKDRLAELGLEDYAEKVKWVSKESDAYGYDILSYTVAKNGKVQKLYIEVKTTTSKVDTEFYVSRNEVSKSIEFSNNYCVYRLYAVKTATPHFYKAFGKIEDNFTLDPMTYMARYKYNVPKSLS